jgi:pullulanase/glycogen debranching enzyme
MYSGEPAGYAQEPAEIVNYVGAHDNETLFDKIQWATPDDAGLDQRVRMHLLALSLVVFAQGIPFFHAGDEILRSKSLDANSYNSSDWFNAIDWTLADNGWGRGLPPSVPQHWGEARSLLRNAALRPSRAQAEFTRDVFCDMLRIRRDCSAFRLRSADEIRRRVRFCNCGPEQIPGLIVMHIDGADPGAPSVMAAWNAAACQQQAHVPIAMGRPLALHPILHQSADVVVRTAGFDAASGVLRMPGLTAAIFC